MLQDNLNRFFTDDFWGWNAGSSRSTVPVNLRENDKAYEMELIAPGLRKEDFKLQAADDMLTISFEGQQEESEENKKEGWLRREYKQQAFTRSFRLDDTVDVNKISASYENGVLKLVLPKKETAQRVSRNIQIN